MDGADANPDQENRLDFTIAGLVLRRFPRRSQQHVAATPKTKSKVADAFPFKGVAQELAALRLAFRELVKSYTTQLEGEISKVELAITTGAASRRKLPLSRAHDLRDMLMLLQSLDVKPIRGRRRDLKKVEAAVEDLQRIVESWA